MDIQQRIGAVILSVSAKGGAVPALDEQLFETGVLDSFGLPDLVAGLENEFSVQIPDNDLRPKNFASILQIENYLASRK